MKNYLNKQERVAILFFTNLLDRVENMIEDWDSRGNLTKNERKWLKSCVTFGIKALESILYRQDRGVVANLQKEKNKSAIHLDMKHSLEVIAKKKSADLKASYEENKEYFKLVELILEHNCNGCRKQFTECEFYKEFEDQCIPYADGNEEFQNCKYSY